MTNLATIGQYDASIQYTNRPTVKVLIKDGEQVLILNDGLLPGGGIDPGESDAMAIKRELQEELGVSVINIKSIGTVVQYRNFLAKKYTIKGYAAQLHTIDGETKPQDEGEAHFISHWLNIEDAIAHVGESIEKLERKPIDNDTTQGRLYNVMTTRAFLRAVRMKYKRVTASSYSQLKLSQ